MNIYARAGLTVMTLESKLLSYLTVHTSSYARSIVGMCGDKEDKTTSLLQRKYHVTNGHIKARLVMWPCNASCQSVPYGLITGKQRNAEKSELA